MNNGYNGVFLVTAEILESSKGCWVYIYKDYSSQVWLNLIEWFKRILLLKINEG
jgi:hypothetical protein